MKQGNYNKVYLAGFQIIDKLFLTEKDLRKGAEEYVKYSRQ
jgi:hypothetical protein